MKPNINIEAISLTNFRRFENTTVNFDPHLTVIVGKNGAGKSSILEGVAIVVSWLMARLRNENGQGQYVDPMSVTNGKPGACVEAQIFGGSVTIPSKAKAGHPKTFSFDISAMKNYISEKRSSFSVNSNTSFPVFASYGVKRAVLDIPLRVRNVEFSQFDAYDSKLDGSANFRRFFTWLRTCEDWENEQNARKAGERTEHPGLRTFRTAMRRMMPEYSDIRIDRHPLHLSLLKNGVRLNAEQLSDGEKIYLALIGDLCHRLSILNPSGNAADGDGIVLIDEIDLHLHPQWQSEIAVKLADAFPNIQFILTTHSPHVLNSVPTQSIRIIEQDGTVSSPAYGFGIPSAIVLEDLMHLSHDVPPIVKAYIDGFYAAFSDGDADNAENFIESLQRSVPNHPDLPAMRKRMERMRR